MIWKPNVTVAAVIQRDGKFLLTSRPEGKVYAGYWEFPGGKLEAGETVEQALRRELHEELGIRIGAALPWKTGLVDYAHARVRLHFCKVFDWQGDFEMRERQTKNFTNPKTKVTSKLEPTAIPGFKASGRLKEKVSG